MRRCLITRNFNLIALAVMVILIMPAMALPTTGAVTSIGNNNATFQATGVTTTGWFMWGMYSGKLYLKTSNATPVTGAISKTVWDYPIYGSTKYYVKACDVTGCGGEVSFTTLPVTPMPTTTYGAPFTNLTESHFDMQFVLSDAVQPYLNPFRNGDDDLLAVGVALITTLVLTAIFFGMWQRGRNTIIPAGVGIILSSMFMSANYGLGLGVLPEYAAIAQGAFCACIAGIVMGLAKKG